MNQKPNPNRFKPPFWSLQKIIYPVRVCHKKTQSVVRDVGGTPLLEMPTTCILQFQVSGPTEDGCRNMQGLCLGHLGHPACTPKIAQKNQFTLTGIPTKEERPRPRTTCLWLAQPITCLYADTCGPFMSLYATPAASN